MGMRETRRERGRRSGEDTVRRVVSELRNTRQAAGVSQRAVGQLVGCSQSEINRIERREYLSVSLPRLCEIAAVLGLEVSVGLHPAGEPIRDKGHQALLARFAGMVSPAWVLRREVPFPMRGDDRTWDAVLRLDQARVGVEAETRVRDVQALVRKVRGRERDSGADHIIVLLSDTAHNRRLVGQLREALGDRYATAAGAVLNELRSGLPISGSAVITI